MDSNLRNLKDFLLLYNNVTEICFTRCVDNFYERNLAANEDACVDKCVTKFARFNHTMMKSYVEVQTEINQRRMLEMEEYQKKLEAEQAAQKALDAQSAETKIPPSTIAS